MLPSYLFKQAVPRARVRRVPALVIPLLFGSLLANAVAQTGNWTGNYLPCDGHSELLNHSHMNLAVRFSTSDRGLALQFARALDFWTTVLDMEWRSENSRACSLAVLDGAGGLFQSGQVARAQFPNTPAFQGWIAFKPKMPIGGDEQYVAAVHELGHVFGLVHNPSPSSVMYFLHLDGPVFLDDEDLRDLAAHHRLRAGQVGEAPIRSVPVLFERKVNEGTGLIERTIYSNRKARPWPASLAEGAPAFL